MDTSNLDVESGSFVVNIQSFNAHLDTMDRSGHKMMMHLDDLIDQKKFLIESWEGRGLDAILDKFTNLTKEMQGEGQKLVNCSKQLRNILEEIISQDQELADHISGNRS